MLFGTCVSSSGRKQPSEYWSVGNKNNDLLISSTDVSCVGWSTLEKGFTATILMENVLLFIQFPYFDDFFRENARDNVEPGFDAHLPVKIKLRYLQIDEGRPFKNVWVKGGVLFYIFPFLFQTIFTNFTHICHFASWQGR